MQPISLVTSSVSNVSFDFTNKEPYQLTRLAILSPLDCVRDGWHVAVKIVFFSFCFHNKVNCPTPTSSVRQPHNTTRLKDIAQAPAHRQS